MFILFLSRMIFLLISALTFLDTSCHWNTSPSPQKQHTFSIYIMFPADVAGHEGLAFSFIKKALVIHFIVLDGKKQVLQCSEISQCDFIISVLKKNKWLTENYKKKGLCWKYMPEDYF